MKIISTLKRIRRRKRVRNVRIPPKIINEEKNNKVKIEKTDKKDDIETSDEKTTKGITFEHVLTEFEIKLRYLNLKDTQNVEYGQYFPPIRSNLIIIDNQGREFLTIRAGRNQISGEIYRLFKVNEYKPGIKITIQYDREEISDTGKHVIHIKTE